MPSILEDRIYGCLLGGLIGDAMGAPVEGWHFDAIVEKYGAEGVVDFDGDGTDDTAIREQLIDALLQHDGYADCDSFAETFKMSREKNYKLWWVPVRNLFHKLDCGIALPVDAGFGNTPSSSSAMAISPMGIVNAGNPRQASLETFDVAGLIHSGASGFCRDAACAIAASVAAALNPDANVASVLAAATAFLHPVSAREMLDGIHETLALADTAGSYEAFRRRFYETRLRSEICDSRETVPAALAIFRLSEGDPARAIRMGANFGRDSDTIATMVGGICGALMGAGAFPADWVRRHESAARPKTYRFVADALAEIVRLKAEASRDHARRIDLLSAPARNSHR